MEDKESEWRPTKTSSDLFSKDFVATQAGFFHLNYEAFILLNADQIEYNLIYIFF